MKRSEKKQHHKTALDNRPQMVTRRREANRETTNICCVHIKTLLAPAIEHVEDRAVGAFSFGSKTKSI